MDGPSRANLPPMKHRGAGARAGVLAVLASVVLLMACRGKAPPPKNLLGEPAKPGERRAAASPTEAGSPERERKRAAAPAAQAPRHAVPPPPSDMSFAMPESGPEHIDPALVSETAGENVAVQMFEGLMMPGLGSTTPRPGQAESYAVSEDGLTYTFTLREGLTWSDGTPIQARDFVYSWERVLNPKTASRAAQILWFIVGAKAYNEGKLQSFEQVGVKATGERTLVVRLVNPTPFFPSLVSEINYAPTPKHVIDPFGERWTRPEHIVVNGPYRMSEHKLRERIVLMKNLHYREAGAVKIPKVVFYHFESETAAFQWYETGKVQVTTQVPDALIPGLLADERRDLVIDPYYLCTYYLVFDLKRVPFRDVRVRRAFNQAIDKERLTAHILKGGRRPATNVVHWSLEREGFRTARGDPFDPESARALLAEAGYPEGVGFPEVTLTYNTYEVHRVIAEYVQRNLKENLSVEIQVQNMEWRSLLKKLNTHDFQIARASWCADYPDPLSFLDVFVPGGENNYPGYKSRAYSAALEKLRREADSERRKDLIVRAESILNRDVPVLPLFFYARVYLLRSYVRGFFPHVMGHHLIRDVSYAPAAPAGAAR